MKTSPYHPFRSLEAKVNYLQYYDEAFWLHPSESRLIDTSYGQTFVRINGAEDLPPLVLFPGAGACSLMWGLNIEALSQNYRTYAVDSLINTGCVGRSVYTQAITGVDDAMVWLNELFDGLCLMDGVNLMGPSYGGWLAGYYALHHPDRLNKVVLIAPAGIVLPFRASYMFRAILLNLIPNRFVYRRFFRWSFPDLAKMDSQMIDLMVDEFLMSARAFIPPNPRELPRLTAMSDDELRSIHVPTLMLVGENEKLYSAQDAIKRVNQIAPHIQTELIPNAGHDLLLVQMESVHQKIFSFLAHRLSTV